MRLPSRVMPTDDDLLDHGDGPVISDGDPTPDDEVELLPLFADALDPATPKTVEEARAEWEELFGAAH